MNAKERSSYVQHLLTSTYPGAVIIRAMVAEYVKVCGDPETRTLAGTGDVPTAALQMLKAAIAADHPGICDGDATEVVAFMLAKRP